MIRIVASTSAALTTAMLPVFLVGALAEELRRDLGFSEAEIGAALTMLFVVAAVAATPIGRVTERVGAAWALRLGVTAAAGVMLGVSALATGFWSFALPLMAAGFAIPLVDTGCARAYADHLTKDQQGRAFGLKEASVPTATLLAGLAVPLVAASHGWRSTFAATVAIAALVLVGVWHVAKKPASSRAAASPAEQAEAGARVSPATIVLASGVGIGAGAATAGAAFLVPALAARDIATSTAGLTLSAASVASIAVRVVAGLWADRPTAQPLTAVILLCAIGSLAAVSLSLSMAFPVILVGSTLLLGAGWGWTGLAFLAAVRANPAAPAAAAGVVLTGLALGGALGPIGFGVLAARLSYTAAWIATAIALALATVTAYSARNAFRRP